MVQFNLLPDIKQQYIKARRTKRLIFLIAGLASVVSLIIFSTTLVTVEFVQKKSIKNLNSDIITYSNKLTSTKNLDKILTVQNQLNTLTPLHDQKVVASRLFTFASQITPDKVTISNLNIDFVANTLTLTGEAPNLDMVNVYTDTLKATNYITAATGTQTKKAFNGVVLTTFGRDSKGATYTITLNFDPTIFSGQSNVTLQIPSGVQSNTTKLFEQQAGN